MTPSTCVFISLLAFLSHRHLFDNVFIETQSSSSSIKEAQRVFLQIDRCCRSAPPQAFVLQACTLPSPPNQVAYHSSFSQAPIRDELVIVIAPYGARQVVIAYSCVCVGHEGRPRAAGPRATRVTYTHAATRNNHLSSI